MSVATINWNGVAGSTPDANSCMITYAAADTLYDTVNAQTFPAGAVSTALDTFLTNHGWSRVTATSGTISTTAGMYAYKAANLNDANGVGSYKYMLLDFRTSGKIFCKVYETIGTDSTLTNLAYQSDVAHGTVSAHTSGSTTYAGKLWIGASARHFVLQSYCNGVYGNQASTTSYLTAASGCLGCAELTRKNAVDLVSTGYPKYLFFCPDINYSAGFAITPKNRYGTGNSAVGCAITNFGLYGAFYPSSGINAVDKYNDSLLGKPLASTINIREYGNASAVTGSIGALFNVIAITWNYGLIVGDDIQIPVASDSNFGNEKFHDPSSGTFTPYWLLGGIATTHRFAVPK